MRIILGYSTIQEILHVFLDFAFLLLTQRHRWVSHTPILIVRRNKLFCNIFSKSLEFILRELVTELVQHMFNGRVNLRDLSATVR